jgi:hypothetical protein
VGHRRALPAGDCRLDDHRVSDPLLNIAWVETLLDADLGTEDGGPTRVMQAVLVVSERVRSYVGWSLTRTQETVTVEGTRRQWLETGLRPLHAVASVTLDGRTLDPSQYRWNRRGRLWRACGWCDTWAPVAIDCDYGYEEVPTDIATVVLSAVRRWGANPDAIRTREVLAQRRSTEGGNERGVEHRGSVTFAGDADGFTIGELVILNRYRRRTAA